MRGEALQADWRYFIYRLGQTCLFYPELQGFHRYKIYKSVEGECNNPHDVIWELRSQRGYYIVYEVTYKLNVIDFACTSYKNHVPDLSRMTIHYLYYVSGNHVSLLMCCILNQGAFLSEFIPANPLYLPCHVRYISDIDDYKELRKNSHKIFNCPLNMLWV